jgi:hypothetical protein
MFERVPNSFKIAALAGVLLMAPATIVAILAGGVFAGMVTVLAFVMYFVVLYMVAMRKYASADEGSRQPGRH